MIGFATWSPFILRNIGVESWPSDNHICESNFYSVLSNCIYKVMMGFSATVTVYTFHVNGKITCISLTHLWP